MELRSTQCALASSMELTIAQAVKVEIKLNMVESAEVIINKPAQKEMVLCCELTRACRTCVVTPAELKRTPRSVLNKRDMKTMLLA
ncbi:MAG: hypothetical protein SGARI_007880 [Bacillariaceae sp.]